MRMRCFLLITWVWVGTSMQSEYFPPRKSDLGRRNENLLPGTLRARSPRLDRNPPSAEQW
jgi:hypothetical protein